MTLRTTAAVLATVALGTALLHHAVLVAALLVPAYVVWMFYRDHLRRRARARQWVPLP